MKKKEDYTEKNYINQILETIQNIASGDFSARAGLSNKDESLDALATGINMLAEEIEAYHKEKDEQAEALLNILEDVNETKEELKKSEEKYRLLAENVSDVIWTMDLDFKFNYYSPSIENQRGYTVEEALNLSLEESITPESMKNVFNAFEEEFVREEQADKDLNRTRSIELEMCCKDGTTIWTEVTATFLRDDSGKAIGIQGLTRNINDRKAAEEALKERERRFRAMIEGGADIITIMDDDGNITYESPSLERVLGYKPEEFLNINVMEIIRPEDIDIIEDLFPKIYNNPRIPVPFQVQFKHKDGTWRTMEASINNLLEDPAISGFVVNSRDITDRKAAEEELQKLASIVKHSGELINLATLEGNMIFLNGAGSDMLGISLEDVKSHQIMEVIPEEHINLVKNELLPKLMNEGHWEGDLQYRNIKTNELIDVHALCFTINNPDTNQPKYLANVSLDITERKKAEEETKREKEFSESAISSLPGIFYVLDQEGRFLNWNDNFVMVTGYTDDELARISPIDLFKGEDRIHIAEKMQQVFETGYAEAEAHFVTKDGREIPFVFTGKLAKIGDNNCLVGVGLDVTELKSTEEKLRKSEENYRTLFDSSRDAIMTLNPPSWKFTSGNPATIELFDARDEAEFTSKGPWDVSPEFQPDGQPSSEKAKKMIGKAMEDGSNFFEWTHKRLGGSDFPATVLLTRVEIEDGKPFLQATVRDISQQKAAELELNKIMVELERSNTELEQFAYVASHDLQEPLRMISGYVQLLSRRYKGKLDDEADEFINFAVDGANRMQRLINDLLKYSRINTKGKEPEETNTDEILNRVLTDLGMMIEDSGAKVEHEELPLVKADDIQLGQVFQNLVGNAIKFHGEQPPEVSVSAEKQGTEWLFKIQDNGVGMDPKFQERAFMIFQREDPHGETQGTGIGLAVVKRIIERHKGKIWFDSEPGKGTTFYFTLPDSKSKGDDK